jgi:peptidoglycan/LPS O-acetylase OafA/YrhL
MENVSKAVHSVQSGERLPQSFPSSFQQRHVLALDGVRGIAVILVIIHHIGQSFPAFEITSAAERFLRLWIIITRPGWLGVDIFFVLSGFLITGVLLDTKGRLHFYRNFYMKRILRIFPLYYLTLIAMLIFYYWPWRFFAVSLVYLSNVSVLLGVPLVMAPLWSLSVEEHFYLVLPWLIRFAQRRTLFWTAIAICIAEPFFRLSAFNNGFFNPYFTWFRLDGLACGTVVAILVRDHPVTQVKAWAAGLCSLSVIIFFVSVPFGRASRLNPLGTMLIYSCISLFTAGVVASIAVMPSVSFFSSLRSAPLRFMGDISYCVYLIHMFVILGFYRFTDSVFHRPYIGGVFHSASLAYGIHFAAVFLICCVIGALSRDYFEGPIRAYRVYFT